MRRITLVLALLLLLLLTAATASADGYGIYTAQLMPTSAGGPHGIATVQRTHTGDYKVNILVWGMEPRTDHAMHFHRGTCAAQGGIIKPLPDVKADRVGMARVTARLSEADWMMITSGSTYINIHVRATTPFGPGITCGNVAAG